MTDAALTTPDKIAADVSGLGERIIAQLKTVYDPEIPVNIFDLGLIYKIDVDPKPDNKYDVKIDMTLTTPNCPVAGQMPAMVQQAVARIEEIDDVAVNLTFTPPWDKERMSDEARVALNMF